MGTHNPAGDRQVILLDLNATLSENMRQVMFGAGTFDSRIRKIERYRPWLVDWLKKSASVIHVLQFTVRKEEFQNATIESIRAKTGWEPDRAYFNSTGIPGKNAAKAKDAILDQIISEGYVADEMFAFESNEATRRMLRRRGVRCIRVSEPDDLMSVAEIRAATMEDCLARERGRR